MNFGVVGYQLGYFYVVAAYLLTKKGKRVECGYDFEVGRF
jgi:hypothetical protein